MIHLHAFGDPYLEKKSGGRLDGITQQTKRFALLIYLVCNRAPRSVRREELISVFWPESNASKGRNNLRQALHVLRREIDPALIRGNGSQEIWVDPSLLTSDVRSFEEAISSGLPETALSLYTNDFLTGFSLYGCPSFSEWVERRQAELRGIATSAAKDLAHQSEGEEDSTGALFWWRKALLIRPFDETIIRRIGSLLAWSGNTGEAMAEITAFRKRMLAELGLEPSTATQELSSRISAEDLSQVERWIGDRRQGWDRNPEPHRRRRADNGENQPGFP